MSLPTVAIVGRPNVGKSTLLNRIVGRRAAIVEEKPGVTRDRKEVEAEWQGRPFRLVDTGGWMPGGDALDAKVSKQSEKAIADADAVLLVVDATVGITEEDGRVAQILRRNGRPVLLVANKVDDSGREAQTWELVRLGLGDPHAVSALHGRGTGDLRLGGGAVDLVGHQQDRHLAAAQAGGDGGVLLGDPDGGVDHEQQEVGVGHGPLGLGDDAGLEAGRLGLPAAGVDELEAPAGPVGLVGDPVPGHARDLLGDGRAAAQDPVDQGRLADVGAPDDGHPGQANRRLVAVLLHRYIALSTHRFDYLSLIWEG